MSKCFPSIPDGWDGSQGTLSLPGTSRCVCLVFQAREVIESFSCGYVLKVWLTLAPLKY